MSGDFIVSFASKWTRRSVFVDSIANKRHLKSRETFEV